MLETRWGPWTESAFANAILQNDSQSFSTVTLCKACLYHFFTPFCICSFLFLKSAQFSTSVQMTQSISLPKSFIWHDSVSLLIFYIILSKMILVYGFTAMGGALACPHRHGFLKSFIVPWTDTSKCFFCISFPVSTAAVISFSVSPTFTLTIASHSLEAV